MSDRALIDQAIAEGRVTHCPPCRQGLDSLPHYDDTVDGQTRYRRRASAYAVAAVRRKEQRERTLAKVLSALEQQPAGVRSTELAIQVGLRLPHVQELLRDLRQRGQAVFAGSSSTARWYPRGAAPLGGPGPKQAAILSDLKAHPGSEVNQIAARIGEPGKRTSERLKRMKARGLVRREDGWRPRWYATGMDKADV